MSTNGGATGPRLGEVVEASSTEFLVHCYGLYESAPLGALVKTDGAGSVLGIVHEVATTSIDPGRHPMAMGAEEETVESIYQSNPQLGRLYSTRFRSLLVGHRSNGDLLRYLAPTPPRIHDHVYRCDGDEIAEFCSSLDFLPTLLNAPVPTQDEVVAAFLRAAAASHPRGEDFRVRAGKELARLLGGQLPRLNTLLKRLSP